jgi:hypothetical protein
MKIICSRTKKEISDLKQIIFINDEPTWIGSLTNKELREHNLEIKEANKTSHNLIDYIEEEQ